MELEEEFPEETELSGTDNQMDKEKLDDQRANTGHKCLKCGREFTLPSNLTRHMRHNKVCGVSDGFKCANCHKVFSLNATMKDHYQRCIAEDPYRFSCPNCTKQFTFKSSLNKHLRGRCRTLNPKKKASRNEQMYSCRYCGADFYNADICQKHENSSHCRIEAETLTHICPHCGRSFTMKSSLKKHMKGRCKVMKSEKGGSNLSENETLFICDESTNSNDEEDVEVYEAWFEEVDVIEECDEEMDEIISDQVESYVEIPSEGDKGDEVVLKSIEHENSNDSTATYTIKTEDEYIEANETES